MGQRLEEGGGWYVSKKLDVEVLNVKHAWGKIDPQKRFPTKLHVPYWSSKPSKLLRVVKYTEWLEQKMESFYMQVIQAGGRST